MGICRPSNGSECDAACSAERERALQHDGWEDNATQGRLVEPAEAEAGWRVLPVGQPGARAEEGGAEGTRNVGLAPHAGGGGIQSGGDGKLDGGE